MAVMKPLGEDKHEIRIKKEGFQDLLFQTNLAAKFIRKCYRWKQHRVRYSKIIIEEKLPHQHL